MKKILIIPMILIGISFGKIHAQTNTDIYIIGTSVNSYDYIIGLNRTNLDKISGVRNPAIVFTIYSEEKSYKLNFNYLDHLRKPNDIVDLPLSRLSDFTLIEVGEFIETHDKMEALKWYQAAFDQTSYENEGKKRIWIIDRNDFYKSSPSLTEPDRMKLIPVIIYAESLPEVPAY